MLETQESISDWGADRHSCSLVEGTDLVGDAPDGRHCPLGLSVIVWGGDGGRLDPLAAPAVFTSILLFNCSPLPHHMPEVELPAPCGGRGTGSD